MRQPLVFNAFAMNAISHIQHGMWRRADTRALEYASLDPWIELAKLLERGRSWLISGRPPSVAAPKMASEHLVHREGAA